MIKNPDGSAQEFVGIDTMCRGGYTEYFVDSSGKGFYFYGEDPGSPSDGMEMTGNWVYADELPDQPVVVGSPDFSELGLSREEYTKYAKMLLDTKSSRRPLNACWMDENGNDLDESSCIPVTVKIPKWMTTGPKWRDS